ncbi:unnamed protein product [Moneuplotes crassus]|uniref:Uncharacterized protein n=1 Tax=Euplotes crassus TaxID=5936 RepID=A0AAD1Y1K1_EUPCR|nr:unnamed protein product [Moneuplotes crassus]
MENSLAILHFLSPHILSSTTNLPIFSIIRATKTLQTPISPNHKKNLLSLPPPLPHLLQTHFSPTKLPTPKISSQSPLLTQNSLCSTQRPN